MKKSQSKAIDIRFESNRKQRISVAVRPPQWRQYLYIEDLNKNTNAFSGVGVSQPL